LADDEGAILFADTSAQPRVAVLHDHDLEVFADHAALAEDSLSGEFHWNDGVKLSLEPVRRADVASRFDFVQSPAANA
jgi:hypothetical protein